MHGLHFLRPGEKHISLGGFLAAVEDNYAQAVAFAKAGILCYLIEHPWSKGKPAFPGIHWVKDWEQLAGRFLSWPDPSAT